MKNHTFSQLAATLFVATQTEEKLRRDQVSSNQQANQIQFEVVRKVHQTIQELGSTMPANLPRKNREVRPT